MQAARRQRRQRRRRARFARVLRLLRAHRSPAAAVGVGVVGGADSKSCAWNRLSPFAGQRKACSREPAAGLRLAGRRLPSCSRRADGLAGAQPARVNPLAALCEREALKRLHPSARTCCVALRCASLRFVLRRSAPRATRRACATRSFILSTLSALRAHSKQAGRQASKQASVHSTSESRCERSERKKRNGEEKQTNFFFFFSKLMTTSNKPAESS